MSSFKKRVNCKSINGTKTSSLNGLAITSTGNPSLDHVIGGGLPVGSVLLIEEDRFSTYSKVMGKYFLAEGIYSEQPIFYATLDDNPSDLLKKLPKPVVNAHYLEDKQKPNLNPIQIEEDEMRIAWRYNELPKINSEQSPDFVNIGHHFNLTEQIDSDILDKAVKYVWNGLNMDITNNTFCNSRYNDLLKKISEVLNLKKFSIEDNNQEKSLLRLCITSLGSPLWYNNNFKEDFLKFLTILRIMIKNTCAVCFLSIPLNLLKILDETLPPQIRNLVDYSFELESFAGSDKETNPAFKEYNGIFHIRKLNAVNSLAAINPETTDLAFKLRRKKFAIEKLHLPPELQEPTDSQQPSTDIMPTLSCASSGGGSIFFQNHLEGVQIH
ncbi:elongator complex protein 4 [Condylostylus longicornis]|uniref:elongator complex protein 4 n=1 Tax=Condylostylus longicornis TaxID=2530218 RepID=UPI00244E27C0|nr:elongator complex protein 4 [Condylostylus longicornis]